jgi:2',3'-cyclic-nucleotide 2'-phosphodiesterase (5'-nucleotidase family)
VKRLALAFVLGWLLQAHPVAQIEPEHTHPRSGGAVTVLQINDVYSTVPIDGVGGLARVATIKRELAASGRTPLLLLAGDFLSSSVASTVFKGEQMIAALNAVGLDVATLGNHEFDFGIDVLLKRMAEARWQWVVSNVLDRRTGKPVGGAAPYVVRTFGALRVGILGLCITTEGMPRDRLAEIELIDPMQAAATHLPALVREQVDVIIALTHLTYAEDRALAERFPEIDLIVGGHEHFPIAATVGRTFISKAGAEARSVARIDLNRRQAGEVERFYELLPVTRAIKEDGRAAAVINGWEAKLGTEMGRTIGRTRVALDGVNTHLRSVETNLGNLVADAIRADVGADVAIVNGGGIRSDKVYPRGPLTRRTLLEIHPFGNVVCKLSVPGRVLLQALNSGVSKLPAPAGQFPQVSGVTFGIDHAAPPGDRLRAVYVNGVPLDADRTYTLAIPDYLVNGGDGYTMFDDQPVLVSAEDGRLVVAALEKYVMARGAVAPAVEGRITRAR